MITKARVIFTRSSTGMFAARTSDGTVSVFELLGGQKVSPGDILSGELGNVSNQQLYNETRDEYLEAFIHESALSVPEAVEKHFAQLVPVISNK